MSQVIIGKNGEWSLYKGIYQGNVTTIKLVGIKNKTQTRSMGLVKRR